MKTSNRQILILSFTLIVVMLGFGMVIPIFPFYIEQLGAGGAELGLLVATSSLLEFIFAPVWGGISDRIGRKPVLMLGMIGYGLSSLLMGFATALWMLFASRALSGILSSATMATALAYVGDSTSEKDRGGWARRWRWASSWGRASGAGSRVIPSPHRSSSPLACPWSPCC
jgi:DHA1 family multidrug resistance protein-like MFS transporter